MRILILLFFPSYCKLFLQQYKSSQTFFGETIFSFNKIRKEGMGGAGGVDWGVGDGGWGEDNKHFNLIGFSKLLRSFSNNRNRFKHSKLS